MIEQQLRDIIGDLNKQKSGACFLSYQQFVQFETYSLRLLHLQPYVLILYILSLSLRRARPPLLVSLSLIYLYAYLRQLSSIIFFTIIFLSTSTISCCNLLHFIACWSCGGRNISGIFLPELLSCDILNKALD